MPPVLAATIVIAGAMVAALMSLTAIGQRRRQSGIGAAVVAGLFFPATWAVWYLHDELPRRHSIRG